MQIKNRQQLLIIVAATAVALFAGNAIVFDPMVKAWKARSARIHKLRTDIKDGKRLIAYEKNDQDLWARRSARTLTNNLAVAAAQVSDAVNRWVDSSGVVLSGVTPQWKPSNEKYSTYECRIDAAGNLETLVHFVYCAETEPLALKIDSIDLGTRDKTGYQLTLGLQISGLILNPNSQAK
jgi:hypothetical protein